VKRLVVLALLATLFLPACGNTDRPEGVVERWLVSLNQGTAGRPDKYAPDELSQRILPSWQNRDPSELDVIEVGKGHVHANVRYDVPFRVKQLNGPEVSGVARLSRSILDGTWRVDETLPADPRLEVPSQGGDRIADTSSAVWLAGIGIAALLVLMSMVLMSTVGKEARVSG
jgi:hypothetical protein